MKKTVLYLLFVIIGLLFISNCTKDQSKKDSNVGLDKSENNNNLQGDNLAEKPVEEIFKADKVNIILKQFIDPEQFLPDDNMYLKLTNKTLFGYNYPAITYPFSDSNKGTVNIVENSQSPFYEIMGENGKGITYTKFYYTDGNIVMRLDHEEVDLTDITGDNSQENLEKIRKNAKKLTFEAVFKKVSL
jgi:hypothetical protein